MDDSIFPKSIALDNDAFIVFVWTQGAMFFSHFGKDQGPIHSVRAHLAVLINPSVALPIVDDCIAVDQINLDSSNPFSIGFIINRQLSYFDWLGHVIHLPIGGLTNKPL